MPLVSEVMPVKAFTTVGLMIGRPFSFSNVCKSVMVWVMTPSVMMPTEMLEAGARFIALYATGNRVGLSPWTLPVSCTLAAGTTIVCISSTVCSPSTDSTVSPSAAGT